MSAVRTLTRFAGTAVHLAAHAVIHPKQAVGTVAGVARDTAATAAAVVLDRGGQGGQHATPPSEADDGVVVAEPGAAVTETPHDGPPPEPTPPPVATEPKPMAGDDWEDELDLAEEDEEDEESAADTGAGGTTYDLQPGEDDQPLIDPSTAKAVRSETETLRKAAEED